MSEKNYLKEIIEGARPLKNEHDLSPLLETLKNKKIVMLGESTHGTKEFYEWRRMISQELISKHGFNFIAVEGDWPSCQKVNHFIRGGRQKPEMSSVRDVLANFSRWPTWPWANVEMIDFVTWLTNWNSQTTKQVGFHGLDIYSFYESVDEVLTQLQKIDPELATDATKHYACLSSYKHNEKAYAQSLFKNHEGCKKEISAVLSETLDRMLKTETENEAWFDAKQNARTALNAENYYRAMLFGEDDSWNVRDGHMMETLNMLIEHYKHDTKAIIWANNTHIGDYRATDMVSNKQINLGGLAREIYGKESVALVGFGTATGSVLASHAWNGPMRTMNIPMPDPNSVEHFFHEASDRLGLLNYYLLFDTHATHSSLESLSEIKGQRAIGVIYDPNHQHGGTYVPTSLSNRYDAFIFFDHTSALSPIKVDVDNNKFPETYPYGSRV